MANRRKYKYDTALKQVCQLIPAHLTAKLAREHGGKSRKISPWSHVVALVFGHLTHALGLNDICDALKHHVGRLFAARRAEAPSRNGLSHANRERPAKMAEQLFWGTLKHLEASHSKFGKGGKRYL